MKALFITIGACIVHTTLLFSQTTYDVLRLSDSQHKGILQFGYADVVFENAVDGNGYSLQVKNWYNNTYNNTFKINANGSVGIGTMTPSAKLEVKGDFKLNDGTAAHKGIIRFGMDDVIIENSPDGSNFTDLRFKNWSGANGYVNTLILKGNGNVGIGTANPGNYKLAVEGKIGAREVVVTTAAWADYVFEPSYHLRPLSEVETYLKENKHLPEIPSAKDVEANGVNLGEMNMLLLKKVEELTLYAIEQQKEINEQKKNVQELLQKVKMLEQQK